MTGVFSQARVVIGRHPNSDLPFDPDRDLDVSGRHAELLREGNAWYVHDLGSRNGTFVNGHRITHDTKLDDTDQIRFGEDGPRIEIHLVGDGTPDRRPAPAAGAPTPTPREMAGTPRPAARRAGSTTQRIRIEVGRQTRKLRAATGVILFVLVAVSAFFIVGNRRQQQRRERDVQAMQLRIDSIFRASEEAVAMLQGQVEGLADALRGSQYDVQRLQSSLEAARASGSDAEVESLRRQLAVATTTFRAQQLAAQVDYRAINEANQFAVAMIWVEFGQNDIATGTAFAVTSDGKLITNRHVVAGEDGSRRPIRIAVQFNASEQVWQARLLTIDQDVDLAVIQVDRIRGGVPTVRGIGTGTAVPATGDPVAVIGFPLGDDLPMRSAGEANLIRSTFTAGTVSKVIPDLIQIDGYGAPGLSGSPVFDRDGNVVAVLYGAQPGTNGRIVFSVPLDFVTDLLQQTN